MTWLRRLVYRLFGDAPDPKWKATGLKFTTAREYLQDKAVAGARRAKRRSDTGKLLHRPKPTPTARVTPFRRAK